MDERPMSSPTQVHYSSHHPMDDNRHPGELQPSPSAYEDLDFAADLPVFAEHLFSIDYDAKPYEASLQTPFQHDDRYFELRNVALDDYRPQYSGHAHLNSLASNSADPPLGTFLHSVSSYTLHLLDLMPQLSLLMSNQLLLDSPYSHMATHTPARRQKSTSISSLNLYATPLRAGVSQSPGIKVGKTPLRLHRRTRLRQADTGLSQLLATIANMKSSQGHLQPSHLNPFEASFISPKLDADYSDYDATPLATPAKNDTAPLFFTPISHSQKFGGALHDTSFSLVSYHSLSQPNSAAQQQRSDILRNDTLDSIKIEDQDDDACKQLRKAKSFTAVSDPARAKLTRATSMRNFAHPDNYTSPLQPFPSVAARPFRSLASIDLLLSDMYSERPSALKSYPASMDLASITNSGMAAHNSPLPPAANGGLLPPIASRRSSSAMPQNSSMHSREQLAQPSRPTTSVGYPTSSQIQEASTTEEIAKFAESILKSDLKRPIVIQEDKGEPIDPKKRHQCPLCLARFQRPEHVKRHLKSHSSERPFMCEHPSCGKRFNRKDNLKAHLKKIHGEKG